jgi:hypothetical protein
MPARERTTCRRCGEIVEISDKGISVFMFCQTIGVKPRRKSAAPTIYVCPSCVMVLAVKFSPDERDFFNLAAYHMIRNLVGMHRLETQQAFAQIFELVIEREGQISEAEIMAALPEPEILLPEPRALKAAS